MDDPDGDPTGYAFVSAGWDEAELDSIYDGCEAEVGEPPTTGFTDEQLRASYAERLDQFECLVREGLVDGDPPSFEVFLSDYQRSGQKSMWEPTEGARSRDNTGPGNICYRAGNAW